MPSPPRAGLRKRLRIITKPSRSIRISLKRKTTWACPRRQGRLDEAIENYRKAIQINPNFAVALNNLGIALADKGRLEEAIENYRKAIQVNPNFAVALKQPGPCPRRQGPVGGSD